MSLLNQIKTRRQQLLDRAHWTVRLPRWENPGIALRFKAAEYTRIDKAINAIDKAKSGDRKYNIQASTLAENVTHIYLIDEADNAEEVTFEELARELGVPESPVHVIRALFFVETDLIGVLNKYSDWAQQEGEQVDGDLIDGDSDDGDDEGN